MSPLILRAIPYLIAACAGFGAAWWLQGLRVTAAQQEFSQYKIDAAQAAATLFETERKRQEGSADEYRKNLAALRKRYVDGWVPKLPAAPALNGVPSAGGADAAGAESVPAPPGITAQVVRDCAVSSLMLNTLQADIAKQQGY